MVRMKSKCLVVLLWAVFFTLSPVWVWALPNGGQIAAGNGAIQSAGGHMTIQQNTQQMITNWQGFSIGAAESVTFQQPNAQATSLNRVLGADPSRIMGRISANGQVFLSNPSGVLFGPGAQVNAHGLIATTLTISDQDFLDGNYRFFQDPTRSLASVINEGRITATGYVGLIAPAVENRGHIMASLGSVVMASGEAGTLDFTGDNLIRFAITQPVSGEVKDTEGNVIKSGVTNTGTLSADGGVVMLSAWDASQVIHNVVNNKGIIQARSVEKKNGQVILHGGPTGTVMHSGTIDVTGDDAGETGGTVHILGENVGLEKTATIDASGMAGGGEVLIGGDQQGQNPQIQNAQATYIGADTVVRADALESGNGGRVIVFANGPSRIYGKLSARGGLLSGNGGFIETSGKDYFDIGQLPDITAPQGKAGTWLIDPNNLTIVAGGGSTDVSTDPDFTSTGQSATLGVDLITAALAEGGTVNVYTGAVDLDPANNSEEFIFDPGKQPGNLTLSTTLDFNGAEEGTLNLFAHNNININADILDSTTGDGDLLNLSLTADSDFSGAGDVNIASGVTVNVGDGDLGIAANDVDIQGQLFSTSRIYVTPRDNETIGVDGASSSGATSNICGGPCGLTLSGTELQNIHVSGGQGFVIGNGFNDDVYVSGLTTAHTANHAYTDFRSAGNVVFKRTSSAFSSSLRVLPFGDIYVHVPVNGTDINLSSVGNVWINADVTASGSYFSFLPAGNFNLAAGNTLTASTDVFLGANDIDLAGNVIAGQTVHVNNSVPSGSIGLGDATGDLTLDNDEVANVTAEGLMVGDLGLDTPQIYVDSLNAEHISNVSIQSAAPGSFRGQITFVGSSNLNNLTLNAGDLILVDGDITTVGNFLAAVDQSFLLGGQEFSFTVDGLGTFELTSSSAITSEGTITIIARDTILNGTLTGTNIGGPESEDPPVCDGSTSCVVPLGVPNPAVANPSVLTQVDEFVKEGTQSTFISYFIADSKTNC